MSRIRWFRYPIEKTPTICLKAIKSIAGAFGAEKKDMDKILAETPVVLKALHGLRERWFRFHGEEDEQQEVVDGDISQLPIVYEFHTDIQYGYAQRVTFLSVLES